MEVEKVGNVENEKDESSQASDQELATKDDGQADIFANGGFDSLEITEKPTLRGGNKEKEDKGKSYLVSQVRDNGVVVCRMRLTIDWPEFMFVPTALLDLTRPIEIGDTLRIHKFQLCESETGWAERGNWLGEVNGRINYQATATEVSRLRQMPTFEATGILVDVQRSKERNLKMALVAAAPFSCIMRAHRRHFPSEIQAYDIKYRAVVRLQLITITQPPSVLYSPKYAYVLPAGAVTRNGDELLLHQANVIARVDPEPISFEFLFYAGLETPKLRLGEKVMAAAVATHAEDVKAELRKYTMAVHPAVEEVINNNKVLINFIVPLQTVEELVAMNKVWDTDVAVSCQVYLDDQARPCAHGFVTAVEKRMLCVGYEFLARILLTHQAAKGQDTQDEFAQLKDGEVSLVILTPQVSVHTLTERMTALASGVCSTLATKNDPLGRIMSILLGKKVPLEDPNPGEGIMKFGAVAMLKEGQRDTAACMLDNVPRVVFQQAGPGTGKTFTAASIMSAILASDPNARILALAPPNVAVVKLVLEMQHALIAGQSNEKMLALFSGTGKVRYAREVDSVSAHLLAAAVEPQEFKALLEDHQQRARVDNYLHACQQNPRLAQEAMVAYIVQQLQERRLCCATLSFAEQIPTLFEQTTHLVIDESGQAPYVQILNLISQLPILTKVLITGDRRQLRVHLPSLPIAVREGFGLDTVIQNLDFADGADVTTLSVCFRSHSSLVRCVEAGFYAPHNETLIPGRNDTERALLTDQPSFNLPKRGTPLILIHQNVPAQRDTLSTSSINPGQTDTALRALWRLSHSFPGASIRCISFYST